ncbi:MAG TPA: ankyrin repeat domain-containing protein [Candidatus Polarisedimenticolia bacterium]|nr:ankyrin repeat domain-containing protein [Candidatus Polarisedimenticolia bacterium]
MREGITERDRLPVWLRVVGVVAAPGTAYFAARMVYEQTLLSWRNGPQLVGFSLAHSGPILLLLASAGVMALWCAGVIGRSLWAMLRGRAVSASRWIVLTVAVCLLLLLAVPYGTWQNLSADRLASGPHAPEFLNYAAATGNLRLVDRFLRSGLDVNTRDAEGGTALYGAAVEGQVKIIELLIARGADVNLRNKWGHSPLYAARATKRDDVIRILEAHGATE